MTQRRFPDTAYNAVTIIGAALAAVCLATIAFLTGVELCSNARRRTSASSRMSSCPCR